MENGWNVWSPQYKIKFWSSSLYQGLHAEQWWFITVKSSTFYDREYSQTHQGNSRSCPYFYGVKCVKHVMRCFTALAKHQWNVLIFHYFMPCKGSKRTLWTLTSVHGPLVPQSNIRSEAVCCLFNILWKFMQAVLFFNINCKLYLA